MILIASVILMRLAKNPPGPLVLRQGRLLSERCFAVEARSFTPFRMTTPDIRASVILIASVILMRLAKNLPVPGVAAGPVTLRTLFRGRSEILHSVQDDNP